MSRTAITNTGKALSLRFAEKYGVEQKMLMETLKQTAFRQKSGAVSDAQMIALLVVADQYGLNPFTREIYAFPDTKSGGIVPVVSVDGWLRIINEHPQFDGVEFRYAETWEVWKTLQKAMPCPDWNEAAISRKDRKQPMIVREYLDECYRPPFKTQNGLVDGPWQTHTKRFLRHKTIIQAGRLAMGFAGIFDEDEARRIVDAEAKIYSIPPTGRPLITTPTEKLESPESPATEQKPEQPQTEYAGIIAGLMAAAAKKKIAPAHVQAALVKAGFGADPMKATPEEQSMVVDVIQGLIDG